MPVFDMWDQAQLTGVVRRSLQTQREDQAFLGDQIAPITPIQARTAKMRIFDQQGFGLGQFKAPDATPGLYKTQQVARDIITELVLLEEMERLSEEDLINLSSNDEAIQRLAGLDLVQRARVLQLRNERLTEWMRWKAFQGALTVTYPTGSQITIDYQIPATHKVTPSVLWSDVANSDPITDIQTWSELLAADSGFYGTKIHITSKTWDYLLRNTKIKNMVNFYAAGAPSINRPTRALINELFTSFAASVEVVIYDNGYRAEGVTGSTTSLGGLYGWPGSITKYLPDGKALMTTEYVVDGQNIADTLDGQVLVGDDPTVEFRAVQGPQSEVLREVVPKTTFLRQASARMPRVLYPECFLFATVA